MVSVHASWNYGLHDGDTDKTQILLIGFQLFPDPSELECSAFDQICTLLLWKIQYVRNGKRGTQLRKNTIDFFI